MSNVLELPTANPEVLVREIATLADDVAYYQSVQASSEHLMRFSPETVEKYKSVADATAARERAVEAGRLRFGIWDEGYFGGNINLTPLPASAEIGYWIDVRHTNKGLASLAVKAVTSYALQAGYDNLFALVDPENVASRRVLSKAGYTEVEQMETRVFYAWRP